MNGDGFFFQAFVYLTAAVISVPIAKRAGLGSVLGYLVAGAVIGPHIFGLVGEEGQQVMHFAEFGVVMMLFLVGLELQPALLWRLRAPILGMGGVQVGLTALALAGIGLALGVHWKTALAAGIILSLSSTAIVLQSLNEKGLMKTLGGQGSFSILLFQDLAVIPMFAILPLLALAAATDVSAAASHAPEHTSAIAALAGWQQGLITVVLIAAIIVGGKLLTRPIFRFIAATRLREVFTAAALLLVIGIALAMEQVGLSPALGTFLAGVVLADSEFRHELESDIEPFKGLLLGLFFISVGASIDFDLLSAHASTITLLISILVVVKFIVLLIIGRLFRMPPSQSFLLSFALAQGGEFAFVLLSFATQHQVFPAATANLLIAVVALSMAVTPLMMIVNDKLVQPIFASGRKKSDREADNMDEDNPVIIAGFGRFGNVVGRLLRANGVATTILDLDPEQIETLRRFGVKVFYGDAGRPDLMHAAGADKARLLILAIDEPEHATAIAEQMRREYPNLKILARADSMHHSYELMEAGVDGVFRETFDSALSLGVDALKMLGFRAYQAQRAAHIFRKHEQSAMAERANLHGEQDEKAYAARVREHISELEQLIREDDRDFSAEADHAWEPTPAKSRDGQ